MSLVASAVLAAATIVEQPLPVPSVVFPLIAVGVFALLGLVAWSYRDVANRHAGKADHDLVGEIHQHEEKQEKRDFPGAFGRRLRGHDWCLPVISLYRDLCLGRSSRAYPMLAMAFGATQLRIFAENARALQLRAARGTRFARNTMDHDRVVAGLRP